jgi:hypothetical protein
VKMAVKVALSKNEYGLLKEVSCFAESGIPFGVSLDGMSSDMLENTLSLAGKGCLHLKPSRGIWGGETSGLVA